LLHTEEVDVNAAALEESQTIAMLSTMAAQHGIDASADDLDQAVDDLKKLARKSDTAR